MRNRIDWSDPRLSSGVYEDMVAVLLSRLHPEAQRIDGSGGDAGRDVQLPLPTGLEIFELKSFTGRLSRERNRRRQVEKSLKRAAKHNPAAWYLVVPIDHTDAELKWFNELTAGYPFRCTWYGETWLNENMASHSDIPRYYLEGTAEEVVRLLREINQEQAVLGRGVPDAVDRIKNLITRLNELDPHYAFGFSVEPNGPITVTMVPRYKGAERDRPVQVGGSFQFPDTEEGRKAAESFQDALDYGTPGTVSGEYVKQLEIDAPAGMGGIFKGGDLKFSLTDNAIAEHVQMTLRVLNQSGKVVAQIALLGQTRTAGQRGGEVKLVDVGGALKVTMRLDVSTHRLNLNYKYAAPPKALPSNLLPALTFLTALQPGGQLVVLVASGLAGPPIAVTDAVHQELRGLRALVQALDDIQRLSGVYFPMPATFSDEDLEHIDEAHRLLSGETITGEWSRLTLTMSVEAFRTGLGQEFTAGEAKNLFTETELILELDGQELPLGRVRKTCATARLEAQPQIAADAPPDEVVSVTFIPGSDHTVSIRSISHVSLRPINASEQALHET